MSNCYPRVQTLLAWAQTLISEFQALLLRFQDSSEGPRTLFWRLQVWFGRPKVSFVELKVFFIDYKGTCPGQILASKASTSGIKVSYLGFSLLSNGLKDLLYASKNPFLGSRDLVQGIETLRAQNSRKPNLRVQTLLLISKSPFPGPKALCWRFKSFLGGSKAFFSWGHGILKVGKHL